MARCIHECMLSINRMWRNEHTGGADRRRVLAALAVMALDSDVIVDAKVRQ